MIDRQVIPISCETHGGWGQLDGVLAFDGQRLQLTYQTKDSVLGVLKSEPQVADLALEIVGGVRFGLGWFWLMPVIELSFSDFVASARLPGANRGRLLLRVAFRDRHHARRLVEQLRFVRSQQQHERIEAEIAELKAGSGAPLLQAVALPPPLPPQAQRPRQYE